MVGFASLHGTRWQKPYGQKQNKLSKCFDYFKVGFPTGRDSATFRDKGTEVPSLSRDKGTTGQAKNLAKGRDGTGRDSQNSGRDGRGQPKSGTGDKMG